MPNWRIPLFKVPMAPMSDVLASLCDVLSSGYLAEGETTARFERALSHVFGGAHVAATNSCTSALTLALKDAGVGPGFRVIVPAQTCIATAAPVLHVGADIVWGDLHSHRGLLDPDDVRRKLAVYSDIRAVIAVHWGGDVCDIDTLRDICHARDVILIEDAAQAFGAATDDGRDIGTTGSDYVCLSFQAIKHLATGDGGAVLCANARVRDRIKKLSWFGIDRAGFRVPETGEINWRCDVVNAGYKAHMNNVTAALGLAQLPHALQGLAKFRENGRYMADALRDMRGLIVPDHAHNSSFWVLSVWTRQRDDLMKWLHAKGIQASQMHCRLDHYSCFKTAVGQESLRGADVFASGQLCLPCGPWMAREDCDAVVVAVKEFFSR